MELNKELTSTYLITGATGYIGSMLAEKLIKEGRKVCLLVRDPGKVKPLLREKGILFTGDICEDKTWKGVERSVDFIVHCAAPTSSAYMISHPVETVQCIVEGTRQVLEFAKQCENCTVLYLSSMEVYGNVDCSDGRRVSEEEQGFVDPFSARSSYPMAKRMAEQLCYLYYKEYGVKTMIARLSQTFGRGILPTDRRIFAQFADAVRKKEDLVLHTSGRSMGNYCDIDDTLQALEFLLQKGEAGQAYNVVNEKNTMSIYEMARLVADQVAGGQIRVVFDIPEENKYGYAADTCLRLSGEKLKKLGWEATVNLEQMYRRLIDMPQSSMP